MTDNPVRKSIGEVFGENCAVESKNYFHPFASPLGASKLWDVSGAEFGCGVSTARLTIIKKDDCKNQRQLKKKKKKNSLEQHIKRDM